MQRPDRVNKETAAEILKRNRFTHHYASKRNDGKYLHTFSTGYNSECPYGMEVILDSLNYVEEFNI